MAISTINPATGEEVRSFEALSEGEIEEKIQRAADTFREYKKTSFEERARMMLRAAEILEEEAEDFGRLMTSEMGKTLAAATAEALASPGLPLRTWRPSPLTRCHCVTTAATIRATVPNVMKRFMSKYLLSLRRTLDTHTSRKHTENASGISSLGPATFREHSTGELQRTPGL